MFNQKDGKPVHVVAVEHTNINGQQVEAGTVIRDCPADLAMELAGSGRVRLATDADIATEAAAKAKAARTAKGATPKPAAPGPGAVGDTNQPPAGT